MFKKLDMVIEEPIMHIGRKCHVKGWNKACVFILRDTDGVNSLLETPKTRRFFKTNKPLIYTRYDMEKLIEGNI